jgi:hypothetical protein
MSYLTVLSVGLVLLFGCASNEIRTGMTLAEVVDRIGEPDFKAILEGKVLTRVPEGETISSESRFVYAYDQLSLRVWFEEGKVTTVTSLDDRSVNPVDSAGADH